MKPAPTPPDFDPRQLKHRGINLTHLVRLCGAYGLMFLGGVAVVALVGLIKQAVPL